MNDECDRIMSATTTKSSSVHIPTHCYFLISIAGGKAEKIVFELATKDAPRTCQNFASFCNSLANKRKDSKSYKNTQFHRIIPKFMAQGGDYENGDGTGGEAFNGGMLMDEPSPLKHDSPGVLSMANRGKNTAGSQFFITFGKASHLDGKHVVFGRVVEGMDAVQKMATVETDEKDRPYAMQKIIIKDCGVGNGSFSDDDSSDDDISLSHERTSKSKKKSSSRRKKPSKHRRDKDRYDYDSGSDDDDSSGSRRRRKHKKHKRRRKKSSRRRSESCDSYSDESSEDRDRDRGRRSRKHSRKDKDREKDKRKRKKRSRHDVDSCSSDDSRRHSRKSRNSKSKSLRKETSTTASSSNAFGKYGIIRESDFMTSTKLKRNFEVWLDQVRGVPTGTNLTKFEVSNYFKDYAEDYNTATLPHIKYYDYDKWEMEEYNKKKEEATSKKGAVGDEFEHQELIRKKAADKRRKEFEMVKTMMSKEKVEEMKRQAQLKAEMVNAYRVGDEENLKRLQKKLEPDER